MFDHFTTLCMKGLTGLKSTWKIWFREKLFIEIAKLFEKDPLSKKLREILYRIKNNKPFENLFLDLLNKQAPSKKRDVRVNHPPYMAEALRIFDTAKS